MRYIPGKDLAVADGLSRLVGFPAYDPSPDDIPLTAMTVAIGDEAMAGSVFSNNDTDESDVDGLRPMVA